MTDRPIDTLSERERESLEGVLAYKTAKEMARDLGISHHAVEKRLKRAREKLGAATSLEAARAYASHYGKTVSGFPDLSDDPAPRHDAPTADGPAFRALHLGGSLTMFTTILLAATLGAGTAAHDADVFTLLDRDGSGYLEQNEFTATVSGPNITALRAVPGEPAAPRTIGPEEAQAMIGQLFERLDLDKDGRINRDEFLARGDTGDVRIVVIEKAE